MSESQFRLISAGIVLVVISIIMVIAIPNIGRLSAEEERRIKEKEATERRFQIDLIKEALREFEEEKGKQ